MRATSLSLVRGTPTPSTPCPHRGVITEQAQEQGGTRRRGVLPSVRPRALHHPYGQAGHHRVAAATYPPPPPPLPTTPRVRDIQDLPSPFTRHEDAAGVLAWAFLALWAPQPSPDDEGDVIADADGVMGQAREIWQKGVAVLSPPSSSPHASLAVSVHREAPIAILPTDDGDDGDVDAEHVVDITRVRCLRPTQAWRDLYPRCKRMLAACPPGTLSMEILELALVYVSQFARAGQHHRPSPVLVGSLVLGTALMLAFKVSHDVSPISMVQWAQGCGMPVSLMTRVERVMLRVCCYRMVHHGPRVLWTLRARLDALC
jgi:hypothetical protein